MGVGWRGRAEHGGLLRFNAFAVRRRGGGGLKLKCNAPAVRRGWGGG